MRRASHFEPDSDDDSVVDEEEVQVCVPRKVSQPPAQALLPAALEFVEVIEEDELLEIAALLEAKEEEALVEMQGKRQQWEKVTQPELKKTVDSLETQIDKLKGQLESTPSDDLEKALESLLGKFKSASCQLYFPDSEHYTASGNIYFAVDDFWLEEVKGSFNLELIPAMGTNIGQIVFVLSGQDDQPGVSAKFHMSNFKLKGDSLLVPSLNYDEMDVEVVFTVTVVLSYDNAENRWKIEEDDLKVDIIELEGPFGLTKGVLSAILGIVTSVIRKKLLKDLPVELGSFVVVLPCPLQVNGTIQAVGQPCWAEVTNPVVSSTSICNLMGQAPAEVLNFHAIQKCLKRDSNKILTSMNDFISYFRKFKGSKFWTAITELWQDAALAYFARTCKFEPSDTADNPSEQTFTSCCSVENLFRGVVNATKMPIGVHIDVQRIEGQYGMKNAIEQSNRFARRMIEEMNKAQADKADKLTAAERHLLESMKAVVLQNNDIFEFILQRVDYMQGTSSVHVDSGPEAELTGTFENLSGQFPIALWTGLPANKIIGGNIIVPTLTKLQTSKEGVLCFQFYQLGSLEMLEKCNLMKWFQDELPDDESLTAIELAELNIFQPMFSFVMDNAVEVPQGGALFTLQVGPVEKDWVPGGVQKNPVREKYLADIKPLGEACPVLVQTSKEVKMMGKVPKVTTSVHLANLVDFFNKHFDDMEALLDVVSLTNGASRDTCFQFVNFAKIVVSILTKYVLKPGSELDINMSTRIVANSADIIVCLENRLPGTSAVDLKAKVDFGEAITDLATLRSALFNVINHKSMIFK